MTTTGKLVLATAAVIIVLFAAAVVAYLGWAQFTS